MEPVRRRVAPGRLPDRVYWFRRGIVLAGVALVIALIVWLSSLTGSPRTAGTAVKPPLAPSSPASAAPTDSTEATALPGQEGGTGFSTSSTRGAPTAPPGTGAPPAECDPGILTLSVSGPGSLKAASTGQFTVTVTNSGLDACTFTFDSRF
ncbi:MAG TPA: hypothetical protein VFK68_03130, partial [Propionibacteriaceae bacterium]|nr:hypothetical protein [Propionibacteriaceae bacterium]